MWWSKQLRRRAILRFPFGEAYISKGLLKWVWWVPRVDKAKGEKAAAEVFAKEAEQQVKVDEADLGKATSFRIRFFFEDLDDGSYTFLNILGLSKILSTGLMVFFLAYVVRSWGIPFAVLSTLIFVCCINLIWNKINFSDSWTNFCETCCENFRNFSEMLMISTFFLCISYALLMNFLCTFFKSA